MNDYIEMARESLGWTKRKMAKELGVSEQTYHGWVNGGEVKEIYVKYVDLLLKSRNLGGFRDQIKNK